MSLLLLSSVDLPARVHQDCANVNLKKRCRVQATLTAQDGKKVVTARCTIDARVLPLASNGNCGIISLVVLDGELAVPCTRNPP
jgi:hypothetical protein